MIVFASSANARVIKRFVTQPQILGGNTSLYGSSQNPVPGYATDCALNIYSLSSQTNVWCNYSEWDSFSQWNHEQVTGQQTNDTSDDSFRLHSGSNYNYCLNAPYRYNGAIVNVYPCNSNPLGDPDQIWVQNPIFFVRSITGGGIYWASRYKLRDSNYCLNNPPANMVNGGRVMIWTCASKPYEDPDQVWIER